MCAHGHNLGNDGGFSPFNTKDICQFLQIDGSCFSDTEYGVAQPRHAEVAQLLIKEGHSELIGQQGNIFDDRLPDAPLLIFRKFDDSGQKGLREKFYAND